MRSFAVFRVNLRQSPPYQLCLLLISIDVIDRKGTKISSYIMRETSLFCHYFTNKFYDLLSHLFSPHGKVVCSACLLHMHADLYILHVLIFFFSKGYLETNYLMIQWTDCHDLLPNDRIFVYR